MPRNSEQSSDSLLDRREFVGKDEFGLLVDGLEPNERVALFLLDVRINYISL